MKTDKDIKVANVAASGPFWSDSPRSCQPHQLCKPRGFGAGDSSSKRCDLVISASLVVFFRIGTIGSFDDEPLFQHSLDRAIQRAGTHLQHAVRPTSNVLDDGVA